MQVSLRSRPSIRPRARRWSRSAGARSGARSRTRTATGRWHRGGRGRGHRHRDGRAGADHAAASGIWHTRSSTTNRQRTVAAGEVLQIEVGAVGCGRSGRSLVHSRISKAFCSAGRAFGKSLAMARMAAGDVAGRRSHRSASTASSWPSSCRRRKASMMLRSGPYRPIAVSSSSSNSVRPTVKVSGSKECQATGASVTGRRWPRGIAMSMTGGIWSVRLRRDQADRGLRRPLDDLVEQSLRQNNARMPDSASLNSRSPAEYAAAISRTRRSNTAFNGSECLGGCKFRGEGIGLCHSQLAEQHHRPRRKPRFPVERRGCRLSDRAVDAQDYAGPVGEFQKMEDAFDGALGLASVPAAVPVPVGAPRYCVCPMRVCPSVRAAGGWGAASRTLAAGRVSRGPSPRAGSGLPVSRRCPALYVTHPAGKIA